MQKTPDEIKKGLECCRKATDTLECPQECPYYKDDCNCGAKPYQDCLAYTQQLEATVSEKENVIAELSGKIGQLEAERDAAVALIPRACAYCKWYGTKHGGFHPDCKNPNGCRNVSGINTGWQWRGVQREE